jgi:hypothetical protein
VTALDARAGRNCISSFDVSILPLIAADYRIRTHLVHGRHIMMEEIETYRIARFGSVAEAENALRCLTDAGIDCHLVPESDEGSPTDIAWSPVHLVCNAADRIQAIVTLDRARVL